MQHTEMRVSKCLTTKYPTPKKTLWIYMHVYMYEKRERMWAGGKAEGQQN